MARKTMDHWIRESLTDPDKDGPCTMLSLVHMVGMQQKEIHTTRLGGGKSWTEKQLSELFRDKASTYAQDLPGVQTFNVLAFYGGRTTPEASFPFLVNPEAAQHGLATESPTEMGRLQQKMRHEEAGMQQIYRRQQVLDEYSLGIIEKQGVMIAGLLEENRDAFQIVKEMLMEQATQRHTREMERLQFERATAERKKLMAFVPPLVNTVTGKEVFPQSTSDSALIEMAAETLSEDKIQQLAAILPPELLGPLAARMAEHLQKKRAAEEQKDRLLSMNGGHPDPEGDAAGDS